MNIAYLLASNDMSGGHRVVFQQAEELAARGFGVSIVCPAPPPGWFAFRNARWDQSSFSASRGLFDADICIATFWTTVAPALAHFKGPVFHLCQGYEADFSFYTTIRAEIKAAYSEPGTRKLVISPHIFRRLRALGYGPVTFIGQAFNAHEFPPAHNRPFDRVPPTILLVGIFEADVKGIQETLTALALIRASGTDFRLIRISSLPLTTAEKDLFPADEYLVKVPLEQMSALYRNSDLLIGPSHPEEGFGLPVLEALSSGLPAILSDTPAHRHIAREAAAYFPCGDSKVLCSQIQRLLPDSDDRARLSALGPMEARRFRTKDVVDKLILLFREALTENNPPE
jgi:glycosyltransferase involved in cell wall biosynthesis